MVVDDDVRLRDLLRRYLTEQGFAVVTAESAPAMNKLWLRERYDLLVLDLMLPGEDGLSICRRLRGAGDSTPVLMLTARDAVDDRVAGLDAGADDYLVKPFALRELKARLRALLRRLDGPNGSGAALRHADLVMDLDAHQVRRGERLLELSRTEYVLLELFLRHPRHVLTRSAIFESVWGYDFGTSSNSLGVYVGYLRRKTESGGEPRLIHTVRGVGYVLRDE